MSNRFIKQDSSVSRAAAFLMKKSNDNTTLARRSSIYLSRRRMWRVVVATFLSGIISDIVLFVATDLSAHEA